MGLDITHRKATLKRPEKLDPFHTDYILENEFEGFNVDFNYFENYIQKIDTPHILETLIFPKKEDELQKVKDFLKKHGQYHFFFENNIQNMNKRVEEFIKNNHISDSLIHTWETTDWTGFDLFKIEKQTGFYFENIGEQRKGMNDNFWKRFYSEDVYDFANKEDFEYAFKCVDYYWDNDTEEDVQQRKKLFKENFVDKYEINKSWLNLCY